MSNQRHISKQKPENIEPKVTCWKDMPEAKEILAFLQFLNHRATDEHVVNLPEGSYDFLNHIHQ